MVSFMMHLQVRTVGEDLAWRCFYTIGADAAAPTLPILPRQPFLNESCQLKTAVHPVFAGPGMNDDVRPAQAAVVELAGLAVAEHGFGGPHPFQAVVGVSIADAVAAVILVARVPHLIARLAVGAIEN